jgi:hypothetical protein
MTRAFHRTRIEYGDFQTPLELASQVCQKLLDLGIAPNVIIEPSCGIGAFVEAAAHEFPSAQKIIGVEINPSYLSDLQARKKLFPGSARIEIRQGDFFSLNWNELLAGLDGSILILGNFPWVTNSQQGLIGGANLPEKFNFQNRSGLDALTGKSNFDISEWMLIQTANRLHNRRGHLAMLCKTSVARKFLNHLYANQFGLLSSSMYGIDAKKYFGVSVKACLLLCEFDPNARNYDYNVFASLDSKDCQRVGHRNGVTVRDLDVFEKLRHLYGNKGDKWRSGIKHDCSEVMELRELGGSYINGLGEVVDLEATFLFPLLKGSDVANNRTATTDRYALVTQKLVGEPTESIRQVAPQTWAYLEAHAKYLGDRKSRIYRDNPRFSIFGVGPYTFAPWKVAICGLYKTLSFRLIGEIKGKPVVFDDTVYFLSFNTRQEAQTILDLLNSSVAANFLSALIFWDEKRPIKTSVLNSLDLQQLEEVYKRR